VLDEATSAVDYETEAAVQRSLARVTHTRATLVITYRLSTIRRADRIHVLDIGEVVEAGDAGGAARARGTLRGAVAAPDRRHDPSSSGRAPLIRCPNLS
jgi:ATP-binding cassette, subfamily B, bacterial